jgi:hypothetical protein
MGKAGDANCGDVVRDCPNIERILQKESQPRGTERIRAKIGEGEGLLLINARFDEHYRNGVWIPDRYKKAWPRGHA